MSLPSELAGPVIVALAKAQEDLPAAASLSGGAIYELKWDGFRCAAVRDDVGARLWSRQRKDFTDRFPEIARAVETQVQPGTVLDGELVIWNDNRLDFDLLQRRMVNRPTRALELSLADPATFMVFDVWPLTEKTSASNRSVSVPFRGSPLAAKLEGGVRRLVASLLRASSP